jgi:hypothetical protein
MTSNYRIHNRGFQLQIPAKTLTSSVLFQEGNKGFTGWDKTLWVVIPVLPKK